MELVCPAGNFPSLKMAVNNGADAVYLGFKDATNARHFAGLNFTEVTLKKAIDYARTRGVRVLLAINTYPQPEGWKHWQNAVDRAVNLGVDALIVADIGILDYATTRWPDLPLHLSVQASATNYEAIRFYAEQFNIRRVVLPRVLSLRQVQQVIASSPVEVEVFGFGSLCVMVEGRCLLSSFASGGSPNTCGACSPAKTVQWIETNAGLESRVGGILIDRYKNDESAGYPVVCKGKFSVKEHSYYAIEEPTSLNTLAILPELKAAGVSAIKLEGRQRSPAYVAQITKVWRAALDQLKHLPNNFSVDAQWLAELTKVAEGTQTTLGAYHRPWQ